MAGRKATELLDDNTIAAQEIAPKKTRAKKTEAADTITEEGKAKKTRTKKAETTAQPEVKTQASSSNAHLFGLSPYAPAKDEDYMSDRQLEHFRNLLNSWKKDLMSEVDRTMTYIQDESSALPDVNDRATQEEEFAIELRTRDRERKLIHKIDKSIRAIDEGDYGYCDTCGIEIGLRRLEARPTATQCIDCKTLSEIKEKQDHGGL